MGRLIECSGLAADVPGYVPGFELSKAAPIQGCSGRSGRSVLYSRARDAHPTRASTPIKILAHEIYTRNTRNTRNKPVKTGLADVSGSERSPEHFNGARNMTNPEPNSPAAWAAARVPGAMPETQAFVQSMRQLLGDDAVNAAMRAAREGQGTFHAIENGIELGVSQERATARLCITCEGWSRPGLSEGHCGAGRADLEPAYGVNHPLKKLPADKGKTCPIWSAA